MSGNRATVASLLRMSIIILILGTGSSGRMLTVDHYEIIRRKVRGNLKGDFFLMVQFMGFLPKGFAWFELGSFSGWSDKRISRIF